MAWGCQIGWLIYNELFTNFSQNDATFATNEVEEITGHPATTYEQFVKDFAGAFGAD